MIPPIRRSVLYPAAPCAIVFVNVKDRLPVGHTFNFQGHTVIVLGWQQPTPIGFKIALQFKSQES